ncbi:efflux RND transporter periplasmic adaptor subunit [Achromobacter aloeverae]
MSRPFLMRALSVVAIGVALVGAGYVAGTYRTATITPTAALPSGPGEKSSANTNDPNSGRKVLYWHDPMVPNQHFDKPGKSPFMDMQLQPVYADDGVAAGIAVDGGLQQSLGIRYAAVRRASTAQAFDAVGTTQFDESIAEVIQSRTTGYIDQLYANAPMQRVEQGAPLASVFVPDWLAPQEEYLALKRAGADRGLLDAARARMRAMSVPLGIVAALDRTGKVQTHLTLSAPRSGVLTELNVRAGAMVVPGQTIAKVAGLSTLWLIVEIPESLALRVQRGMRVDATFEGDVTEHFSGHIREILPGINTSSRTLQARLEIANPAFRLTPGMLMRVRVRSPEQTSRLYVPSEAVITTGKRSIVIVKNDHGRLQPVEIKVGIDQGDDTEVISGLAEGQQVVASGQFLIDSEASLKSMLPRLKANAPPTESTTAPSLPAPAATVYETTGKVETVTDAQITFSHEPVPALGWGAMTMSFEKPSPSAFSDVKAGATVHFSFTQSDSGYRLTKVQPMGEAK